MTVSTDGAQLADDSPDTYAQLEAAATAVRDQVAGVRDPVAGERIQLAGVRAASFPRPRIGIVLGSGLGALTESVEVEARIAYRDIPHMSAPAAPGHAGVLLLGRLEGQSVALLSGRTHLYEGHDVDRVVFGVRLLRHLGAELLIVTNAAGGVNTRFTPGLLMCISDHINLTGRNPLIGPADPRLGLRFPDMSTAYDPALRDIAKRAAEEVNVPLAEGVYMAFLGPSYETPAEIRMARTLGADAIGMSTVLEVIAAHHMGMRVLGISCITNMAAGILPQRLTEEEVIETANAVREAFSTLVRRVIYLYGEEVTA